MTWQALAYFIPAGLCIYGGWIARGWWDETNRGDAHVVQLPPRSTPPRSCVRLLEEEQHHA